jgi:hypothetical protein
MMCCFLALSRAWAVLRPTECVLVGSGWVARTRFLFGTRHDPLLDYPGGIAADYGPFRDVMVNGRRRTHHRAFTNPDSRPYEGAGCNPSVVGDLNRLCNQP